MSALRTSPFAPLFHGLHNGAPLDGGSDAASYGATAPNDNLAIFDVSSVPRTTLKGKTSADALLESGLAVPEQWFVPVELDAWSFVARTGRTEFWVEGPAATGFARGSCLDYPRQDGSLLLVGKRLPELLSELVAIPIDLAERRLHLTEFARVSAALLPRPGAVPSVQLWVDPTYATYVGDVLFDIARELGGVRLLASSETTGCSRPN